MQGTSEGMGEQSRDSFIQRSVEKCGNQINEFLDVEVSDGVITLARQFRHKTLEDRAAEYDGKLMLDGEYDWGDRLEERCGNGVFTPRRYS